MIEDNLVLTIFVYVLVFIAAIFITRAIFSIPKFLNLQKAQFQILTELAMKQGVKNEVIQSIRDNCNVSLRVETDSETELRLQKSRTPDDDDLEKEALSHPKE